MLSHTVEANAQSPCYMVIDWRSGHNATNRIDVPYQQAVPLDQNPLKATSQLPLSTPISDIPPMRVDAQNPPSVQARVS
jgi:hypothetical protein